MQSSGSSFVSCYDKPTASPPANWEISLLTSYFPTQKSKSTWSRIRWVGRWMDVFSQSIDLRMIFRQTIREPMAELAGVAIFVLFGTGVNCSVALSKNQAVASSPKGVRYLQPSTTARSELICDVAIGLPLR